MIPSVKSEGVEQAIAAISGVDRRAAILADKCVAKPIGCGGDVIGFRDQLSVTEYTISGLCQFCQDKIFSRRKQARRGKLSIKPPRQGGLQKDGSFLVTGRMPMKSGAYEASKFIYRKLETKEGKVWLYPINSNSPAEQVHFHDPKDTKSDGYGGSTLNFLLEDGSIYAAKGPWRANANAMFAQTGVDIRNTHWTYGCVALKREHEKDNWSVTIFREVLFADEAAVLGPFNRIRDLAQLHADRLRHPVAYYSQSSGGSASGFVVPSGTEWRSWDSWFKSDAK